MKYTAHEGKRGGLLGEEVDRQEAGRIEKGGE